MKTSKITHGADWVLRIDTEHGIGVIGRPLVLGDSLWLAVNRDTENGYEARYLEIVDGEIIRDIHEDRGLLPSLFSYEEMPWAIVLDPYGDKDREFFAPVLDRDQAPKRFPPFNGEIVGVHESVLHLHRSDGAKGDRILTVTLGPKVKRGKQIKLPFPYNQIVVEDDGLHALSNTQPFLHRRLGATGEVLQERTLRVDVGGAESWARRPISLGAGDLLVLANGDIRRLRFDEDGAQTSSTTLATFESLSNLWPVQRGGKGHVATFNGAASGWIHFTDEGARDVFTTCGHAAGFTDTAGNVLELMEGSWPTPKLAGSEDRYYAICQPESRRSKSLFVIARSCADER